MKSKILSRLLLCLVTLCCSSVAAFAVAGGAEPVEASSNLVRLNMKSYGNHNATYDARIIAMKPEMCLDNPPHGLYGEMYGYNDSTLLQNVAGYQAVGIKVIGYITCGYEGGIGEDTGGDGYDPYWYSLALQKKLITNMATLDGVDGVFIDECSGFPHAASKAYLLELTALAHSHGLLVWGNVGVDNFDEWFFTQGGFDYMQSSESWTGQALSAVQQEWGHRIGVTGYKRTYTVEQAYDLTIDAWSKGIHYCYINTVEYTAIAPWFEDYVAAIKAMQDSYYIKTAPSVITHDATSVVNTSATINADLTDMGAAADVNVSFIWGTANGGPYNTTTPNQTVSATGTFSANLTGLTPGTTYYYKAKAVGDNLIFGRQATFTTTTGSTTPPSVTTNDATNVTPNTVRLNGNLTSLGSSSSVAVSFVWGTASGSYPNETTGASKTGTGTYYHDLGSLTPGTIYYYKAKAVGDGTAYGTEKTFLTVDSAVPADVNGDGIVNVADITFLERTIVGLEGETSGADANGDGVVNSADITKIERIIAGLP